MTGPVAADNPIVSPAVVLTYYPGSDTTGTALAGAPTNAGTYTVLASFAGNTNYEGDTDTTTIVINKAVATVAVTWASPQTYNGSTHPATAVVNGVGGDTNLSPAATLEYFAGATAGAAGTGLVTAPTNAGTWTVRASFAGNGNYNSTSDTKTIVIDKATPTVTLTITPATQQYSDTVNLSVVISPTIAGTVQFQKSTNGGTSYANIGSPVTVSSGAAALNNQQITDAPSTAVVRFKAEFTPTDSSNYVNSSDNKELTVTQENADAVYSGPSLVFTPSISTGSASVQLQAVITDAPDSSRGEIRNATVDFINTETSAVLCSVSYPTRTTTGNLFLIDTLGATAATVGCTTTLSAGTDSTSYNIGIRIGNYYTRVAQLDDAMLTVALPIATQFITGGGYLKLSDKTAGSYAGDIGSKTNFGFNVKYNNKGTNLQGRVNVVIRRNGRVYQVKGNNLGSLGVSYCKMVGTAPACYASPPIPCTLNASSTCWIKATFRTQANLTDVTNPLAPVTVASGTTLQMDMTDYGEPGSNGPAGPDLMAMTLSDKNGNLLYANNWNTGQSTQQLLTGGNLVVH